MVLVDRKNSIEKIPLRVHSKVWHYDKWLILRNLVNSQLPFLFVFPALLDVGALRHFDLHLLLGAAGNI